MNTADELEDALLTTVVGLSFFAQIIEGFQAFSSSDVEKENSQAYIDKLLAAIDILREQFSINDEQITQYISEMENLNVTS